MQEFYAAETIPVLSCILMPTRESALSCPRHDLRLGFCPACGFIANIAFDASHNAYSPAYEESLGSSPTFDRFARELARRLVERHHLRGRTVLEIGCGKGEFLALLCDLAPCHGIGVDPALRSGRTPTHAESHITFIQDVYDDRWAHLEADFVVCRHTLDHIAPTFEFLSTLRRHIGERSESAVFFELPDVTRQLGEGAFWELCYEHCSYFSAGSLARLFRLAGFQVTDLELAFGQQYILMTARPGPGLTGRPLVIEDDLDKLKALVAAFPRVCSAMLRKWSDYFRGRFDAGDRVVVWGAGSKGVSLLTTLRLEREIEFVVDINPYKQGRFMPGSGQEIVGPGFLSRYMPDCVVVMNPLYLQEIGRQLRDMGLAPEVVAV